MEGAREPKGRGVYRGGAGKASRADKIESKIRQGMMLIDVSLVSLGVALDAVSRRIVLIVHDLSLTEYDAWEKRNLRRTRSDTVSPILITSVIVAPPHPPR